MSEQLASLAREGSIRAGVGGDAVTPTLRDAINRRLRGVLDEWRATPPEARLVLAWPDGLTIRNGRIPVR